MFLVAHRFPRTAAGCESFVAAGAEMFECDVQFRGRTVVVSHFLPLLNRRGWLEQDNGRFRWRKGVLQRDPALLDALDMIPASCRVLLDPKETDPVRRARLIDELARILPDHNRDRFRVSTDREDDLAGFRAAGFGTWRTVKNPGQLTAALSADRLPEIGVSLRHTLAIAGNVAALHRVTDTVVAWTVNSVDRAKSVRGTGVDGLTTDSVEVMRAVRPL